MQATKVAAKETKKEAAHILVVDDEKSLCELLEITFRKDGHRVEVANGVEAARRKLEGSLFDIVISDIRMPGKVNGADVHAWIQKNRPELRTRIILISGDTANSETQTLLAQSGTPCIEKPFRVQQLMSVVEKTFGKP